LPVGMWEGEAEFVLMTVWDSVEAMREFTGGEEPVC